ncbi:MAG: DUF3052 domain-containing protein [Marmoricola sp.]
MAGYSGNTLERKLGVKDSQTVYLDGAPNGFFLTCPTTARLPKMSPISLTFHTSPETLARRMPILIERTEQAGMIWVCWPKKAAARLGYPSDLDENLVRRIGLDAGMVDVKVCAIDEIWSGLKFVRRLADRV